MNLKSAAKFLGIDRVTLYDYEQTVPGFPQRITIGRSKYFRTDDLRNYVQQKQPDTTPQPTVSDKVKNALKKTPMYVTESVRI